MAMYASAEDRIGDAATIAEVSDKWRSLGMPVELKVWPKAKHCALFKVFPEEYLQTTKKFYETIKKDAPKRV